MLSVGRSSATVCLLVQLAVGNIIGAVARPSEPKWTPTLKISSNLEPGRMYLGDVIGPFVEGKNLSIVCSTDYFKAVSLSWWEGEDQLPTVGSAENRTVSKSLFVGTLQAKDSLRHFTCRDLVSGAEKSVDLHLVDDHMEIQMNGLFLEDNEEVIVFHGEEDFNLNCIVNGSDPSTGTWYEGKKKLPSKRTESPFAIHNHLALRPRRDQDNGRQLTCRARNGQLTKTVVLNVVDGSRDQALDQPTTGRSATTGLPGHDIEITLPTTAKEVKMYLIAGVAAISFIGALVVVLIVVIVKMGKKIIKQDPAYLQRQGNSSEVQTDSPRSDMSASLIPPLAQPSDSGGVRRDSPSSGGRMSAAMPHDSDHHSYYYPDLTYNSYYYPKTTDGIRGNILMT